MTDDIQSIEDMFIELIIKAAAYGLPQEAISRLEYERDEFLEIHKRKRDSL